ncbi:TPA: DUF2534 family protein, partial [Klebsiella pneumoniae]|nr:DUF2534 family protein [Klebsiella pneumoniae]
QPATGELTRNLIYSTKPIAVCVVSKAAFQGVEDQYNLPMETWDTSLFIIQGAWVAIYSLMFAIVGSLPFGFYFLGPMGEKG